LWSSGGNSDNTNPVIDNGLNNMCCLSNLTMVGKKIAFTGYSPAYGSEIWMGSVKNPSTEDNAVVNVIKPTEELTGLTGIYPNPANNILNVGVSSSLEGIVTITVVDVNGTALFTKTLGSGETNTQINIANLPAGVYFVKIISSNSSTVRKFVKM
jgi:hypothetical protein